MHPRLDSALSTLVPTYGWGLSHKVLLDPTREVGVLIDLLPTLLSLP